MTLYCQIACVMLSARITSKIMGGGPENMSSDSEPKNFFWPFRGYLGPSKIGLLGGRHFYLGGQALPDPTVIRALVMLLKISSLSTDIYVQRVWKKGDSEELRRLTAIKWIGICRQ
jgi:hypothetical protein